MLGDINLFLHESQTASNPENSHRIIGEVNLMLARSTSRGFGFGQEALLAFIYYVLEYQTDILKERSKGYETHDVLVAFQAKIDENNNSSIKLFERLGFRRVAERPNYFGEFELIVDIEELGERMKSLKKAEHIQVVGYQA
jgi:RimJ/RimL family protein N-acetyltransferase